MISSTRTPSVQPEVGRVPAAVQGEPTPPSQAVPAVQHRAQTQHSGEQSAPVWTSQSWKNYNEHSCPPIEWRLEKMHFRALSEIFVGNLAPLSLD